jgi:hypothetical protein
MKRILGIVVVILGAWAGIVGLLELLLLAKDILTNTHFWATCAAAIISVILFFRGCRLLESPRKKRIRELMRDIQWAPLKVRGGK